MCIISYVKHNIITSLGMSVSNSIVVYVTSNVPIDGVWAIIENILLARFTVFV